MRAMIGLPATLLLLAAACAPDLPTAATAPEGRAVFALAGDRCSNIAGSVTARFLSEAEREAVAAIAPGAVIGGTLFDDQGNAIGDAYAWIDDLLPRGAGAFHIAMRHRYVLGDSSFDTSDEGTLAPIDLPLFHFNNRLAITGGTGALAAASGLVRASGTVELGGDIMLRYHGRICS
jgi:hypothetical protein